MLAAFLALLPPILAAQAPGLLATLPLGGTS